MSEYKCRWDEVFYPGATVVYVNEDDSVLGVWNGSLLINWFLVMSDGFYNFDVITLAEESTLKEAINAAQDHADEYAAHVEAV